MTRFVKQNGRCIRCGEAVYEIQDIFPSQHPLAGQPRRLGRALPAHTQVEFQLTDGSVCHIDCCLACAHALTPEDYLACWEAVLDRQMISNQLQRLTNQLTDVGHHRIMRAFMAMFPLGILRRRMENPHADSPQATLMIDRRPPPPPAHG